MASWNLHYNLWNVIQGAQFIYRSNKIYFWTATIHNWYHLLQSDASKQLIVDSLLFLSNKELIDVYSFVIMPNHLHLIWKQNQLNGRETPKGSLLKYTAHKLLEQLKHDGLASIYEVNAANKRHEIWQRDAFGIEVYSRAFAKQKLNYIHENPVKGKWNLAVDDISYPFSSAKFYETGEDDFGFLKNIFTVFDG